jgi:hypothetical protein
MAEQYVVSEYVSIILRAIDATQHNPAELRRLVYDVTRINLGKLVLSRYNELGSAGLQKYLVALELAIKEAEGICRERDKELPPPLLDQPLLGRSAISADNAAVIADDQPRANSLSALSLSREVRASPEVLSPIEIWEPAFGRTKRRNVSASRIRLDMVAAVLIGFAIYVVTLARSDYFPELLRAGQRSSLVESVRSAPADADIKPTSRLKAAELRSTDASKDPGFPLPTQYGVYAISAGKLFPLNVLPLKIPDPRVAISALFSSSSRETLPDGNLSFVIYRRDLANSAPMQIFVRIVAQIAREIEFSGKSSPTITDVDGQWAVRGKAYEFGVAPLDDNPEMVILHPKDPNLKLSPGRYALVIAGQGYDFTIDGRITDAAQCLERTSVVGGAVYSECRKLP